MKIRHVKIYNCKKCGKKRVAYKYQRAKNEICTKCETPKINENQLKLI